MYLHLGFVLKQNETELAVCFFLFQNETESIYAKDYAVPQWESALQKNVGVWLSNHCRFRPVVQVKPC